MVLSLTECEIDIDFEGHRRDDVKRYMESVYGKDRVCSIGTYSKLQVKAALKEMAVGVSAKDMNFATKFIGDRNGGWAEIFSTAVKKPAFKSFVTSHPDLINNARIVMGQPKSQSIHACATIILPGDGPDIFDSIPVREVDGMLVSEWEGEYLEAAGYLKEDILGIRQLDKFRHTIDSIERVTGEVVDIYTIPLDDSAVYERFCDGLNADVFHFGTDGLTGMVAEMQPVRIQDLIATISLYRPGAMESGSHKKYVKIRNGEAVPEYDFGLESVVKDTYGLFIYQEQVMKACQVLGGFTLAEADNIRKAMGKKNRALIDKYGDQFIKHAVEVNKCPSDKAKDIWGKLEVFAGYGFNACVLHSTMLYRAGTNKGKELSVGEMFKTLNDKTWALDNGKNHLRKRYARYGYGYGWSLNEDGRLRKNRIVDIRFAGTRDTYTVTSESGAAIVVTMNHKFPTDRGEIPLSDIIIGDRIPVNKGYVNDYKRASSARSVESNVPTKGEQGFQKLLGNSAKENREKSAAYTGNCQKCGATHRKIEMHHIDRHPSNSSDDNLIHLCPSCHKKEHYSAGRTRQGEKGLITAMEKIVSIEYFGVEDVYDVEMEHPYHTFAVSTGVVTCNSHAAAYAITGYISQWFKVHYPIHFWSTAFEFADKDDISGLLAEIHVSGGVSLCPPDINNSDKEFKTDYSTNTIYWSLLRVDQVGDAAASAIISARNDNGGSFFSLSEFLSLLPKSIMKKNVVESLILSGSFDALCDVSFPHDRMKIMKMYETLSKRKPGEISGSYIDSIYANDDWWWELKRLRASGLASIDYQAMAKTVDFPNHKIYKHITPISVDRHVGKKVYVGGVIVEVDKHSGKKGSFANVRLDVNNATMYITVWSEAWEKHGAELDSSVGKVLIVSGTATFDSWKQKTVITTSDFSRFVIID